MTKASRVIANFFPLLFLLNAGCSKENGCESIQDPYECMSHKECVYKSLTPFTRTDGGRFECHPSDFIGKCMTRKCGYREEGFIFWRQMCAMVDGQEYVEMISECYPSHVQVYPCEGHENQYDNCINEDVCAYCGNGIQDRCERCDGELYESFPCVGWLEGATGGMITRCNATCDDYDFSDCTTD